MVLVWTEQGQLVMVPQQVLAQAQAKSQGQTMANISQRPATPTAGTAIRVSTATTVRLPFITVTHRLSDHSEEKVPALRFGLDSQLHGR